MKYIVHEDENKTKKKVKKNPYAIVCFSSCFYFPSESIMSIWLFTKGMMRMSAWSRLRLVFLLLNVSSLPLKICFCKIEVNGYFTGISSCSEKTLEIRFHYLNRYLSKCVGMLVPCYLWYCCLFLLKKVSSVHVKSLLFTNVKYQSSTEINWFATREQTLHCYYFA